MRPSPKELLEGYDTDKLTIATLASHSSLQIFHGAKREGFKTVAVVEAQRLWFYRHFGNLIDHFVVVERWGELCREGVIRRLRELNSVMVPHGSYVEYVGLECAESLPVPIFGSRRLFRVEANQSEKMRLLAEAGIPTPKAYALGEEVKGLAIVKLPGAKGGRGYFVERDARRIADRLKRYVNEGVIRDFSEAIIQEYVFGVTAYYHYFYSPVLNRLELLGADIRYESEADGIARVPPRFLEELGVEPTFTVVGNIPLVLRESLLPTILKYGLQFVEATKRLYPPGIIGPFCLESVIDRDLRIVVFEFSGRIVAGTNLYIDGSPYSYLYWDEPMSMGRRIARELKLALERGVLDEVVT